MFRGVSMVATVSDIKKLKYQEEHNFGRGLRIKANKDGSCSWFFRQKMRGYKSPVYMKLGNWPDISIDDAEDKARIYRLKISEDIHPKDYETEQLELEKAKELEEISKALTLRQLLEMYENSRDLYGKPNQPSTIKDRRWGISSVFAEWMDKPAQDITKLVVNNKINEWSSQRGSKGQVLKVCDYMSAIWNFFINSDVLEKNPFDIKKGRYTRVGKPQKEYLQIKECADMITFISKYDKENLTAMNLDAIALTALTGLRKDEVLNFRWSDIFLSREQYTPASGPYFNIIKSKQQEPMGIPITKQMLPYFERCLARVDEFKRINEKRAGMTKRRGKHLYNLEYVFPSPRTDKAITNSKSGYSILNETFTELEKAKKIGAQILRKTFATSAYSLGYTMEQIGLFTGHTSAIANTKVATDAYVARQADDHRKGFETINSVLVGETTIDLVPIPDNSEVYDEAGSILDERLKEQIERLDAYKKNPTPEALARINLEDKLLARIGEKHTDASDKYEAELLDEKKYLQEQSDKS